MAEAITRGAGDLGTLIPAEETGPADMLAADAYIFVCPENLGSMSGAMKEMFDRCYYPVLGRVEGRAYATAIAAGSAGQGAESQIDRITTGWRLRRVSESLIVNLAVQTPDSILALKTVPEHELEKCYQLGKAIAEGIALGIF